MDLDYQDNLLPERALYPGGPFSPMSPFGPRVPIGPASPGRPSGPENKDSINLQYSTIIKSYKVHNKISSLPGNPRGPSKPG